MTQLILICTVCGEDATYHSPFYDWEHWTCDNPACDNELCTNGSEADNNDFNFKVVGYICA